MNTPVVDLRAVTCTYPGPPAVTAVHATTVTIHPGEHVALVGPSGSGKSTLMNLLGLLDRPTTGTYHLDGHDTAALREVDRTALRAHRIGFVFQAFHLLAHRSVVDNVATGLLYDGTRHHERRRRAHHLLERVGLAHRAHAAAAHLSGGERQRVAIARALISQPSLLLCDEPTGNLDTTTAAAQVLALIDEVHQAGQTIIVITHDPAVAARATRRLHIRDGNVTEPTHPQVTP